jgi:hypothetical protein
MDVVTRASILLHEARHAGGCWHNGNNAQGRCDDNSCDKSLSNGCRAGTGTGPQGFQWHWLVQFAIADEAIVDRDIATPRRRRTAAIVANERANTRFDIHPGRCVGFDAITGRFYVAPLTGTDCSNADIYAYNP